MAKRKSKMITDKAEIDKLISMSLDQLTKLSFIMDTFGEFKGKRKHEPYDLITIPAGAYGSATKKNKKQFVTTIGLWIFNKTFIEPDLFDIFHYISSPITKGMAGDINKKITYAVLEDKVPLQALKNFTMKVQKFQPYSNILCWSFSNDLLLSTSKIDKKKKELEKKYKEGLAKRDPAAAVAMEKELLDYAKDILKDDPSMDMFTSGAKGSFKNNFKNLFVMRGAIKDPNPTKGYDIVESNYMDGISKDDYVAMAKSLAFGPYSRAKKTQYGGYLEKLFLRAFQHMVLLPAGTDCGTKRTIDITLSKDVIGMVMYQYIVEGNKLVELTSDNVSKYLNKRVKMRFPSLCESEKGICNKCMGNLFYRMGIENIGVATPQIASRLKVISLKAFHDSQITLYDMDVAKAFGMED